MEIIFNEILILEMIRNILLGIYILYALSGWIPAWVWVENESDNKQRSSWNDEEQYKEKPLPRHYRIYTQFWLFNILCIIVLICLVILINWGAITVVW